MAKPSDPSNEPLAVALPRRRLLRWMLWGGAAGLAVVSGGVTLLRRSPQDVLLLPTDLKNLSQSEYLLFKRLSEVLLPPGGRLPPPVSVPVLENIDHMFGLLSAKVRRDLGLALALLDNSAVVLSGQWRRFVDLTEDQARQYLEAWLNGKSEIKRAVAFAASKIVYTAYFQCEAVWPALQYDGPVSRRLHIPMQGNAPLPL